MNTIKEFNEKYKAFLEEGHYGLAIDNQNVITYLDEKFQEFIKVPGFTYSQIKIKFSSVRFYATNVPTSEVELKLQEILFIEK